MTSLGRYCVLGKALSLIAFIMISGCASSEVPSGSPPAPQSGPNTSGGYLSQDKIPDSICLIPHYPFEPAVRAMDTEITDKYVKLQRSPTWQKRWDLARKDATVDFPEAPAAFSCSLNSPITDQDTHRLYILMQRTWKDAGASVQQAKDRYKRLRPFVKNRGQPCTPDPKEVEFLKSNFSYPSGHAAIGWTWSLILAEIAPDRASALIARGRAYGESRVVCNVHWESDVIEGRVLGAATVAALHSDPLFQKDFDAAKKEVEAAHAKGLKPTRNCNEEIEALGLQPPQAP